jgi:hypothetical protein
VRDGVLGAAQPFLPRAAIERFARILLFDEGDALFGERSELHDGHDRYANVEIRPADGCTDVPADGRHLTILQLSN